MSNEVTIGYAVVTPGQNLNKNGQKASVMPRDSQTVFDFDLQRFISMGKCKTE